MGIVAFARAYVLAHGVLQGLQQRFIVDGLSRNSAAPDLNARRHISTVRWPVSMMMGWSTPSRTSVSSTR